jgi:flagellar FliJ protein
MSSSLIQVVLPASRIASLAVSSRRSPRLPKARELWQQRYARLEGLRKLVKRYLDEARLAEDKREQKLLDELSQRLSGRDSLS